MKLKILGIGALVFGMFALLAAPNSCAMKRSGGGSGSSAPTQGDNAVALTTNLQNAQRVLRFESLGAAGRYLSSNTSRFEKLQLLRSEPSDPSNPNSPKIYVLYIF